MMLSSLPLLEPRDSHTLWYTPSQGQRNAASTSQSNSQNNSNNNGQPNQLNTARRNAAANRALSNMAASADSLATLILEERALRLRKQNIASFGYSWIRPAGFPKTMMGIREEEMEREEAATAGEMDYMVDGAVEEDEDGGDMLGEGEEGEGGDMERDLDGDIPDADEIEGLMEEGDEGLADEDEFNDGDEEDGLMERDLDDDVPEGFGDEDEDEEEDEDDDDFDEEGDEVDENEEDGYGDEIEIEEQSYDEDGLRSPSAMHENRRESMMMDRDLDGSVLSAGGEDVSQNQEWEHTDTEEEEEDYDDEDDDEDMDVEDSTQLSYLRSSLSAYASQHAAHLPRHSPARQETEAERLFLERWSGGGEGGGSVDFGSSGMLPENSLHIPRRRSRRPQSHEPDDSIL